MMSGSLQAPSAALTAMLELTDNPDIILPGMLAVVVAVVVERVSAPGIARIYRVLTCDTVERCFCYCY